MADIKNTLTALADVNSNFSLGNILSEISRQWSGPQGFAKELKRDFDTCPIGHANRIRMECDILRLLAGFKGELDDLPDDIETLEAVAREAMKNNDQ